MDLPVPYRFTGQALLFRRRYAGMSHTRVVSHDMGFHPFWPLTVVALLKLPDAIFKGHAKLRAPYFLS
jgi:hypothetical protein